MQLSLFSGSGFTHRVAIPFIATCVALGACAHFPARISYFDMAPRLEYQGFSFDRPPNAHWYLLHSEQDYTDVTLRRDTASPTHTFYARISLSSLGRQPASHEDFAVLARSEGQRAPYQLREVSREQELTTIQNQWCIRIDSFSIVRGAPQAPEEELHMTVRGFRCLHPAFPKTCIDFFYSERGRPKELDGTLAREGEEFLRGVRIDVAPGTPAS